VEGVFGVFDVTAILHALSQRSNTDLLSAPKVVTKAGQEAVIKVVTEYIYPTTFTVQQATTSTGNNGGVAAAIPPSVEPGSFQTREVGVILQVVPEVSAEGQMINLTMNPQVVSEPTWHDYGYDVVLPNGDGTTATTHLPMAQPFFQVRSVSTSVSIYNGATVVMGGMITENRLSSDDKIPLLGDLPYFGQFFSSKSEQTIKRNLLIFVTARLVDPAGRSLKTQTEPVLSPKLVSEPKPESL
jgi:general secretion pathway protein D